MDRMISRRNYIRPLTGMLLGLVAFISLTLGSVAVAEEEKKKKKTRRAPTISQSLYKQISEAQIMIDPDSIPREEGEPAPEPKGTPRDGINLLLELTQKKRLNSNEISQIWNLLAFGYYTIDDMDNTLKAYEQVLAARSQGVIMESLETNALRALFQLYYQREEYRKSLRYMDEWESVTEKRDAAVTYLRATAHYQLEEFRESLKWAIETENIATAEGKELKENWIYLQVVLYNELEDIDNVIRVLERMVVTWPKKQYWMHLAGMYSEKEWDDQALSTYYAIYVQGLLEKDSELVMLSQRLLNADVPYEAASVLEDGLESGIVEQSEKNLRLLATCYTLAQEMSKAIEAWTRASEYAEDGSIFYRLAQALAQEDRHEEAIKAYDRALKDEELDDLSDAYFWLAISHMQISNWDLATSAFRSAAKYDEKIAKQSRQYIRYIAGEKRRLAALKDMLEG